MDRLALSPWINLPHPTGKAHANSIHANPAIEACCILRGLENPATWSALKREDTRNERTYCFHCEWNAFTLFGSLVALGGWVVWTRLELNSPRNFASDAVFVQSF